MKPIKFEVDGFKAKRFNCISDGDYASYTIKVKIDRPVLIDHAPYYARRSDYAIMKNLTEFYYAHFEKRCSHDWDCCGCWFTNLCDVKRKGKIVYFKISAARNY